MTASWPRAALPLPLLRRGKVREVYEVDARPPAARGQRPGQRVRRRDGRADPAQGRRAHPAQRVLVRAAGQRVPVALHHRGRRRDRRRGSGARARIASQMAGRTMLVRRTEPVPFECVVRGYLSGSAWEEYRRRGTLAGEPLPAGLARERPPRAADLFARHQGGDGPRRERDRSIAIAAALGPALAGRAARRELRALRGGPRPRRDPRDHHRRHQVRVRHGPDGHAAADRRGADARIRRGSGRPTAISRAAPSRASTSSRSATISRNSGGDGRWNGEAPPPPLPPEVVDGDERADTSRPFAASPGRDLPEDVVMRIAPEGWPFIIGAWVIVVGARRWVRTLGGRRGGLAARSLAIWVVAFFRDPVRERAPRRRSRHRAGRRQGGERDRDRRAGISSAARRTRVSIFMNVFDVHVNRYPVERNGELPALQRRASSATPAAEKASLENEQSSIGLVTPRGKDARPADRRADRPADRHRPSGRHDGAAGRANGHDPLRLAGGPLPPAGRPGPGRSPAQRTRAGVTVVAQWS